MTAAAFSGDYVDLKFVKTRKVAQVYIEIPLEQAAAFVAAFGAPNPANGVPVAVARLIEASEAQPASKKEKRDWKALTPAEQAGIRCADENFWEFLSSQCTSDCNNADEAAAFVRGACDIKSRSELNVDDKARAKWKRLDDAYYAWSRGWEG